MRSIGVITVGRSDFGLYRPILKQSEQISGIKMMLFVTGTHLSAAHGMTVSEIERDYIVQEKIPVQYQKDSADGIAEIMGQVIKGMGEALVRSRPDILLALGDRFEMHAAVAASIPHRIPVAHIHGGEITEGSFDNILRHSITKMSHLHFVAAEEFAERVRKMGEEDWRITVSGAPGLDNLSLIKKLSLSDLEQKLNIQFKNKPLLVTFHPVTFEADKTEFYVRELCAALEFCEQSIIFTAPNTDTHNSAIRSCCQHFVKSHPNARFVENLGTEAYFGLMSIAAAMVGNSSSGLLEAPLFELPVVNIGTRQGGRLRGINVIDADYSKEDIWRALKQAVSEDFRESLKGMKNPYGDGCSAPRILHRLRDVSLNDRLLIKSFPDHSLVPVGVQ